LILFHIFYTTLYHTKTDPWRTKQIGWG